MKDVDYNETDVEVVKSMIWKFLLVLIVKYDLEMKQIVVVTAFLKISLQKKI